MKFLLLQSILLISFLIVVITASPSHQQQQQEEQEVEISAAEQKTGPGDNDRHRQQQQEEFLERFLREGYNAAPEVPATEEFRNACLKQKNDRLIVFKKPSSSFSSSSSVVFKKGSAFLATDLCAMGHTAKDAPLLLSWALDAEGLTEDLLMEEAFRAYCDLKKKGGKNNKKRSSSSARSSMCQPPRRHEMLFKDNAAGAKVRQNNGASSSDLPPPPVKYVVFGNMCMSKSDKILPNKRTPVFHKVLWSWFRAVMERIVFLRQRRYNRNSNSNPKMTKEESAEPIVELHFSDFAAHKTMCFENIVVRKENWRWVRAEYHADQFRIALWKHFNVSDRNQVAKLAAGQHHQQYQQQQNTPKFVLDRSCLVPKTVPYRSSNDDSIMSSMMMDSLRASSLHRVHESMALSISELDQRIHRHRHGDKTQKMKYNDINNNNNHVDDDDDDDDVALSLRSRFPSALLPLRVTVLVRDEDRHFQEKEVGAYIEQYFGPDLVDVRLEKFDSLKGDKHYKPPSHPEQLQILFDTDILVAAHGAGLAAVLAMRPGSAVVEFFPHNFKYYMYEEAAQLARVFYKRYESPIVWPKRCCSVSPLAKSNFSSRPMALNGLGARACKKCDTFVTPKSIAEIVAGAVRAVIYAHN